MNFLLALKTANLTNIYLKCFLRRFADIDKAPIDFHMEVIDFQERTDLKAKYVEMNLGDFYRKYLDQEEFSNLRKFMTTQMALFGSTYLCEQFFRKMGFVISLLISNYTRTLGK